jgi:succinate dehydrogenase/fumarate reductase cytochrome b subunit
MKVGPALGASAGTDRRRAMGKSRWPARLDLVQSLSGLLLALFMWGHMFFVSSILLGKDAMWTVTRFFEGYFLFGRSYPWIVPLAVAGVITLLVVHAMLAVRKFPIKLHPVPHVPRPRRDDEARRHDALVVAGRHRLRDVLPRHDPPTCDSHPARAHRPVRERRSGLERPLLARSTWCCCSSSSCTAASACTGSP